MKKIIAVVGCGHWGKNLVRNFSELGALNCIFDENTKVSNDLSKKYNIEVKSFEEIINDPSILGVVLAVPAYLHSPMSIKAMENGKHVYVEKPLALNIGDAKNMIETSQKKNVHLMVGHLLQYHPVFLKLKEIVLGNGVGQLRYVYSNRLSLGKVRSEENVIWSFAPHDISMVLSLIDQIPRKVSVNSMSILQKDIEDISDIHLYFKNNVMARISVSWLNPEKEQKLVVIGEKGMMIFDDVLPWGQKLKYIDYEYDYSSSPPVIKKKDPQNINVEQSEPLKNECKYFIDLIDGKEEPRTDGHEGLKVLNILEKISNSDHKD